ncbi:hypothetical protein SLA2020_439300 [Shorea laevis]
MSNIPNLSSPFLQKNSLSTSHDDSFLEQENEQDHINGTDDGEILGVILSRSNSSLSAFFHQKQTERSLSMRSSEKQSTVESAVRRAFSMRASSTPVVVSEGYRRIDHRCDSDEDDERLIAPDAGKMDMDKYSTVRQTRTNKRRGNNIFEACRRLLGF